MTIWRGDFPLILASQSAARKTLLYNAGISFEALPADIDEREIQTASGLTSPSEIPMSKCSGHSTGSSDAAKARRAASPRAKPSRSTAT